MKRRAGLPTLNAAIEWLDQHWSDRDTPTRLHQREHEGWGLMFAPAFARRLDAKPDDKVWRTETVACRHHRRGTGTVYECPDCHGDGTYSVSGLAYLYPTWRALDLLAIRSKASWDVVLTLVVNGYSMAAMRTLGIGDGVVLAAIRRLFDCYEKAPEARVVPHTEKSESQITAETAA